ncbi:g13004 [Coccomyxa viridis]|uniref:G13004 protein n=1 Tax=Coccomyxa viridis TaxID=1274662 RepID=A0ABP1GBQ9_9CHLO
MAYSGARNTAIQLTQQEEELFGILLKTLEHQHLNTVLRCAGGWVRDKLLGKDSHDIDIAIDNKLGGEFAEHVNTYLSSQDLETRRIAVIESNPEQSKHLETARMKVAGLELDLVNLRSEQYADQTSRIPTMEFGTPEQDALRRDLTINSLFYNINTREVEDFTGKGLDDLLEHRLIRTPLPPSETFRDDPLRVLRAIRFGARFGFRLDEELEQAAASEPVSLYSFLTIQL